MRELLRLIIQNRASLEEPPVVTLYDKLQTHLHNLETLKITSQNYAPFLLPLVSSCLSEDLLKLWERNSSSQANASSEEQLNSLLEFLKAEVEGNQKLEPSHATVRKKECVG